MNIRLLSAFILAFGSFVVYQQMVARPAKPPEAQGSDAGNAPKAINPLAFQEPDNKRIMKILLNLLTNTEEMRVKLADALYVAHRASVLRTATLTAEKFTEEAHALVDELHGFLEVLDMARSVIEESFDKSSLINYDAEQKQKAILIRLIGLQQQEQRQLLKEAVHNVTEFKHLLDQLAAVREVLWANLHSKVREFVTPRIKNHIAKAQQASVANDSDGAAAGIVDAGAEN